MNKRRKVTIAQVAKEANVSKQTVSRVLNDRPDVASETRRRVQAVIERLNYQPSALARSLTQQRSATIGVITAGLQFIGPSRTLKGIVRQAQESGYSVLLKELSKYGAGDAGPALDSLISRHVDGIIWSVPEIGENMTLILALQPDIDLPMIYLTTEPYPSVPTIVIDNVLGGRLATRHLLEQGYRHIGHISGPMNWLAARKRKAGWEQALGGAKRDGELDGYWVEGDWSPESGANAFMQLLQQAPDLDAVFVANDQMAMAVLKVAWEQGITVGEELGVVGFDGIPETAYTMPPLSTIRQDQRKLGRLAVTELVEIIEAAESAGEGAEPRTSELPLELLVRQSSMKKAGYRTDRTITAPDRQYEIRTMTME